MATARLSALPAWWLIRFLWLFGTLVAVVVLCAVIAALVPPPRPNSPDLRAFQATLLAALKGTTESQVLFPPDIVAAWPTMCLVRPYETIQGRIGSVLSFYNATTPMKRRLGDGEYVLVFLGQGRADIVHLPQNRIEVRLDAPCYATRERAMTARLAERAMSPILVLH